VPLTLNQIAEAMMKCRDSQNQLPAGVPKEFEDTKQFESLLGQLIDRCRAMQPEWKLGQPFVFPFGVTKKEKEKLFGWFRSSVGTTLRLPCDLCQALVPAAHYAKADRHECAKLAQYLHYSELLFAGAAKIAGLEDVKPPSMTERKQAKEVWDAAVHSHSKMTMEVKADAMELALQLEEGDEFYILPTTAGDQDRIRELVPENANGTHEAARSVLMAGLKLIFRHARADGSQKTLTVFHAKVEQAFYRIREKTWTKRDKLCDSVEYSTLLRSLDKQRVYRVPLKKAELKKIKQEQVKKEKKEKRERLKDEKFKLEKAEQLKLDDDKMKTEQLDVLSLSLRDEDEKMEGSQEVIVT